MSLEEWRSCVWKWWKLSPVGKIPRWKFQYHQIQRTRIHIKILRKRLDQVFKSAFSQKFFDYMSRSKRCSPKFLKCFINSGFVFTIPIYFHIIASNYIKIYMNIYTFYFHDFLTWNKNLILKTWLNKKNIFTKKALQHREAIESITKYFKSGQITQLRTKITFKHRSKRVKLTNITLITKDRFEAL